jgi:hypothetical protein
MALSEHEQRLLEQIERALYAEDPKFASTVRGARLRRPSRSRRIQGVALFLLGVALLVLGVAALPIKLASIPVVSVGGFLVMFAGALLMLTTIGRGKSTETSGESTGRSSFAQRMEERFRRRFDDH